MLHGQKWLDEFEPFIIHKISQKISNDIHKTTAARDIRYVYLILLMKPSCHNLLSSKKKIKMWKIKKTSVQWLIRSRALNEPCERRMRTDIIVCLWFKLGFSGNVADVWKEKKVKTSECLNLLNVHSFTNFKRLKKNCSYIILHWNKRQLKCT